MMHRSKTSEKTTRPVSNQQEKPTSALREGSRARQCISRSDKEPEPAKPATTVKKATISRATPSSNQNVVKPADKATTPPVAVKSKPHYGMPSQALNKHKQADPWSTKKKHKTNFGAAYSAGNIPCRINHGGIKNNLQWNTMPEELDYNPILVTCCEGFQETDHPYVFLARQGFQELMQANGADEKVRPLLGLLIPPIRGALMSPDDDVITIALQAIQLIAEAVGSDMNVHLAKLIQQIHRKYSTKNLRNTIDATLASLERNGGTEALRIIRTKIPTFVSLS